MKLILLVPITCSALAMVVGCGAPGKAGAPVPVEPPKAATLTVPIDVSKATVGDFVPADMPMLKRHLAASSQWKLTRDGSSLVAVRREPADESTPEAGKLRLTPDGFYFKHQPWRRYRARLALGAIPPVPDQGWQAIRTEATRSPREALLTVQPVAHPDYRSYLLVSGENNLYLEILEESMDTGRESTRRLLRETDEELEKLLDRGSDGQAGGKQEGLPTGSTSTAPASLRVEPTLRSEGYHVYGYVNPGAEGAVYLRLFDAAGKEIAPESVKAQTLEYVGWSTNGKIQYFFNSRLDSGSATPAPSRAELWFQAEKSGSPRKLLQAKVG